MTMSVASPPAPPPSPRPSGTLRTMLAAPAAKIALVLALLLLLLVPAQYVSGLIHERQQRQADIAADFVRSWGPSQIVPAPLLVVPYRRDGTETQRFLHIAPTQLSVTAHVEPQRRRRGLFGAIVYDTVIHFKGTMSVPPGADSAGLLDWEKIFIAQGATDLRGMTGGTHLTWNGQPIAWSDCTAEDCDSDHYLQAHVPPLTGAIPFEVTVALRGTETLWLAPLGRQVDVSIDGPWSTPSFVGTALPTTSDVTGDGFSASWALAGNPASRRLSWTSTQVLAPPEDKIGVELLEPVPTYRMVDRSDKYSLFFLALSFLTYFLFEMVAHTRIHLVQYGLMGLSMSLFALLLISLSEPLGFSEGYLLSALLILAQASLYTAATTRSLRHAGIFALVLASLFGFNYVALRLESYALLTGALALFVALSGVMAATRHIDWSATRPTAPARPMPQTD